MKHTLYQLPSKKQHEIRQIVDIIRGVVDPEMVILFGSYAKNRYVEHRYTSDGILYEYISDYDFLVVTKGNSEKTYVQEHKIMELTDQFEPPVNLEIHEIDFINKGLEWGEYFWVDIVKEGIVLFDKETVKFAELRELSPAEKKEKAQKYFDTWFPQAKAFLRSSVFFLNENSLSLGDFQLHQSAESLYYTVLTVFTEYKPKAHNLWKLRKKAKPHSAELHHIFRAETDKNEERLFELLKQGYIEARYDPQFVITEVDLRTLIDKVNEMVPIIEKICIEKIASLE